jgi:hypothetical protein
MRVLCVLCVLCRLRMLASVLLHLLLLGQGLLLGPWCLVSSSGMRPVCRLCMQLLQEHDGMYVAQWWRWHHGNRRHVHVHFPWLTYDVA